MSESFKWRGKSRPDEPIKWRGGKTPEITGQQSEDTKPFVNSSEEVLISEATTEGPVNKPSVEELAQGLFREQYEKQIARINKQIEAVKEAGAKHLIPILEKEREEWEEKISKTQK